MLCLKNPCENTFLKPWIFGFKKKNLNMLGYWPYATQEKFYVLSKHKQTQLNQVSQLKKQAVHIYLSKFIGSLKQFKSSKAWYSNLKLNPEYKSVC